MDDKKSQSPGFSEGLMGLLLGLVVLAIGFWMARQSHTLWNLWPNTDAIVVGASIVESADVPSAKGGGAFYSYTPRVQLGYTVGGKQFTTYAPSDFSADTRAMAAAHVTHNYEPGMHHPIRYNPRNPGEIQFSAIDSGPLILIFFLLLTGASFAAIGFKAVILGFAQLIRPITAADQASPSAAPDFGKSRPPAAPVAAIATVVCPRCGQRIKASEENCPNCLKMLRAA